MIVFILAKSFQFCALHSVITLFSSFSWIRPSMVLFL